MSWTIPSREEADEFTKAYLAAEESYYDELECKEDFFENNEITHWTPLPEPPKEETDGA